MAITTTPPAEVLASMRAILDYDWATELRDYEEQGEPEGHVFEHLLRVNRWLEEDQPAPAETVHVVNVEDRTDGYYVFADRDDAKAFEVTIDADAFASSSCYRTEETVCDHADALKLIAAECEASEEAVAASLESGVPVATRAWAKGEDAPYSDKLETVEYTYYPHAVDPDEGPGPARNTTLWVGLHPEMGCVNVDAGRERLEAEGWEVTDWGAA